MHAAFVHMFVSVCGCTHARYFTWMCMHACLYLACIKCFLTLKLIHHFITVLSTKQGLSKQMSNIATEQKDLKQSKEIDYSFTFNSKVSNIVDDYLFSKETVKSGLLVQWKVKRG